MKRVKDSVKKIFGWVLTPFILIGRLFKKVTAPITRTKLWKKARRTFLKSPFKGYFRDSFKELKHVTWPDTKTSLKLTAVVIAFSVVFALFTTALDAGFDRLAKAIFLN